MEGRSRRGWSRRVALVVAGMVAGSMLIAPATAHLNSPLTFKHLKKHFFTKKVANARFIDNNEGRDRFLDTVKTIVVHDSISSASKETDALCPAGYVAVGGSVHLHSANPSATISSSGPLIASASLATATAGENIAPNGWRARVENTAGNDAYSVGVICSK